MSGLQLDGIAPTTLNTYTWPENFGLDTEGFGSIDDLVMQSKKLVEDSDDSGNSTGISTDYGSSSPESNHGHYPSMPMSKETTSSLLNIKQETSESLLLGGMSSPDESPQLSDSYYSNPETTSAADTERSGSKKTAYNEKWGVKVLKAWAIENNEPADFENLAPEELNTVLAKFWSEVRKSNGDYYGRNSLFNLRAMINKHLKGKPYCVSFDIVTDERFRSSNERLEKQLKLLKGIGRTITHKQPISIADLRRMYDSGVLGTSNPLSLLRKVWFEITLHFCHKGSESQEKLLKTSFEIYRDASGRAYVARGRPHQGRNGEIDDVRMYETGGDLCPVKSYQLYLMKLHPLQPRLFQQPRRKATTDSPMWYGKAPNGEKALQQMMANISAAAKLSKRYTNHCVRTTALEQFSTSRRARQATSAAAAVAAVNMQQPQPQQTTQQTMSAHSSPRSNSPMGSPQSITSNNSNRSSPNLARSQMTVQDYKCGIQQAVQQAAQYQQSLQQFAQSQMENQIQQMKQNSALSAFNFLSNHSQQQGGINPLSSDPLYDAPPATPIYTKTEDSASSHSSDLDSGIRCSTPKSPLSSIDSCPTSLGKISSEDLLNFQATTEAQAFMLNTLNQLGPSDISDRLAAMGSLFGLDDYNFNNLKQFSQLGGITCNF
jgi:hypothetical protein